MQRFRQITDKEWVKGDYREFVHINIETSYLAEKYKISFEDCFADGLGEAKFAFLITENGTQFYVQENLLDMIPIQTYIGCLNNPETIAEHIDEILEVLELSSEVIEFIYGDVKLNPHELWRQDDNGHKFLVEKFACKADAAKVMKTFENRHHKQTYWIKKTE